VARKKRGISCNGVGGPLLYTQSCRITGSRMEGGKMATWLDDVLMMS
jgi:hypothetical protein